MEGHHPSSTSLASSKASSTPSLPLGQKSDYSIAKSSFAAGGPSQDSIPPLPSTFQPISLSSPTVPVPENEKPNHPTDIESLSHSDPSSRSSPPAFVRKFKTWRWLLVCTSVYSSSFLYGLDNTIVADIQTAAVESFGNVEKLGWLGIGFPLGSVATILGFSKAYATFDVKWLYIGSLIMFEAGSALCGGAPTMDALIVGRVWAGAGGAGMYLGALNILTINTSDIERPMYMSLNGLTWGAGCILGPIIGGSFADSSATWRWSFYINLVLFALVSPICLFILEPYTAQPGRSLKERLLTMDWLGLLLNAVIYVLFCMALTLGGTTWSWTDSRIIVIYVFFFVALIAFILTQYFCVFTTEKTRLFPVSFLKRRTLMLVYITMSCVSTALFVPIYYIPLYFSFVYHYSGIQSAVALLPFVCVTIAVIMLNGYLLPRFGYYQPWYIASFILITIGGSLMYALIDATTAKGTIYGLSVILAVGVGLSAANGYSVVPPKVEEHQIPDAIGFVNTAQIGSAAIALTISSAIFQNVGYTNVAKALGGSGQFTPDQIHAALAGATSTVLTSIPENVRERVIDGIVKTISDSYVLCIVAGALGLICSLFMRREKLVMEAGAMG